MYGLITLACLVAVAGFSHAVPYGYGGLGGYGLSAPIITAPIISPAVSTANLVKAAPIPIIKTLPAPIITAPIIKTVPIVVGGGWNGVGGWGGWNGLGGYGLGGWGGWNGGWGKGWGGWGGWGKL